MQITDRMAENIKGSPDKVQEAMDETIAEATVYDMYQQVPCGICKAVAQVLSDDLLASWRPEWSEERLLSHVQQFCESDALPGDYQVVEKSGAKSEAKQKAYQVEKGMKG